MNSTGTCAQCGATLAGLSAGERCPRCVFAFALDPEAAETGQTPAPERVRVHYFGDYELQGEIARGGMGVVYKARQVSLNRTVAVKMLLSGPFSSAEYVRRFRTEAEAAANLQHPNIVAIYEVGDHDGQQYLSMEYVEGQNLTELARDQPLPAHRAAALCRTIADAIEFAHQRGVIHRDLKPSNVLVSDRDGQPRVTDFGLAKRLVPDSSTGGSADGLTVTGQILGTPGFMPPEQARGERPVVVAAAAVDIYSIGAILYFLTTARAPFAAESLEATLRQVLADEPVSPRLLNRNVPRDLEIICLRCLEKEPRNRFPSARALAEELGRFLEGRPILSRAVSPAEKAWRWTRRHPTVAALCLALAGALAAGLAGVQWQLRRARASELAARATAYAADMHLLRSALEENNLRRARELLERHRPQPGQVDQRNWEWRYAWQQCRSDAIASLGAVPDEALPQLLLAPDLLSRAQSPASAVTGTRSATRPATFQQLVVAVAPRRNRLAASSARGEVRIHESNARAGASPEPVTLHHTNTVTSLSFSGDGEWLASATVGGHVYVWDWRRQVLIRSLRTPTFTARFFGKNAFAPTGRQLAIGKSNGNLDLIDAETGEVIWAIAAHRGPISALAYSPNGQWIASGSGFGESAIRIWDAASGREVAAVGGHSAWISALAFSADGSRLASASAEQTICLWDTTSWTRVNTLLGEGPEGQCLIFAQDGRTLASVGPDGGINVWETQRASRPNHPIIHPDRLSHAAFSPDHRTMYAVADGIVLAQNVTNFAEQARVPALGTNNAWVALSPDGAALIAGDEGGGLNVWNLSAARVVARIRAHTGRLQGLGFAADGRTLFSVGADRWVKSWRTADWTAVGGWSWPDGLTPHPGRLLPQHGWWISQHPGQVRVWQAADGRLVATLPTEDSLVDDVACSPDGRRLVTAHQSGRFRVFDTRTWQLSRAVQAQITGVHGLAFTPDGHRLVTGNNGREALTWWDTGSWHELTTLPSEGAIFRALQFSPDGTTLLATSRRTRQLWRAPTFDEIRQAEADRPPGGRAAPTATTPRSFSDIPRHQDRLRTQAP